MFRGKEIVRFCSDDPETAVVRKVRDALADLGRVAVDRSGVIAIEPAERFNSALAVTTIGGSVRKELNQFSVRIDHDSRLTAAGWAVLVVGLPVLLLGGLALMAPLSARRRVADAVRKALHNMSDALGGAVDQRFTRKAPRGRA